VRHPRYPFLGGGQREPFDRSKRDSRGPHSGCGLSGLLASGDARAVRPHPREAVGGGHGPPTEGLLQRRPRGGGLRVVYKIRVPQEITSMDVSGNGKHFTIWLSNGKMIVKSRLAVKEGEGEEDKEKRMIKNPLVDTFVSKAQGYKYFFRG
jgi:hypothetical protein